MSRLEKYYRQVLDESENPVGWTPRLPTYRVGDLRCSWKTLDEIMAEHPEITEAAIRELAQRLDVVVSKISLPDANT